MPGKTEEKPQPPARRQYRALDMSDEDMREMVEAIQENLAGQNISARDLKKITVPAQGMTKWVVSDANGKEEYVDELEGIIVHLQTPRAYWSQPLDMSKRTPPDCSSQDGIKGVGEPGGDCNACPFNEWGSATTGRGTGKACKEQRLLYVLFPEDFLPTVVQGPVTSIESLKKYFMDLSTRKPTLRYKRVYTNMTLDKVEGEFVYSRIHFSTTGEVEEELRDKLDRYTAAVTRILGTATYEPEPIEILMAEEAAAGLNPGRADEPQEETQNGVQAPPDLVVDQMLQDPVNNGVSDGTQEEGAGEDQGEGEPQQGQLVTDPDAEPQQSN